MDKLHFLCVKCKACKFSENMTFYENVYMCNKINRMFLSGDGGCSFGELVSNPNGITDDNYVPQSTEDAERLFKLRNK